MSDKEIAYPVRNSLVAENEEELAGAFEGLIQIFDNVMIDILNKRFRSLPDWATERYVEDVRRAASVHGTRMVRAIKTLRPITGLRPAEGSPE